MIAINPISRETQCYENGKWAKLHKFPRVPFREAFHNHQLVVADNELYLGGGSHEVAVMVDRPMEATLHLDHFYRYDRLRNEWMQLRSMLAKRSCCAMVHLKEHIYAIGGQGGLSCRWQSNVERYSLVTGEWEVVPYLPAMLQSPSVVAYKDHLLVYGVLGSGMGFVHGWLVAYDPQSTRWTVLLTELLQGPNSRHIVNDFWPVLVVDNRECYRVRYVNKVAQVNRLTLQLHDTDVSSGTLCSLHNPADQTKVCVYPDVGPFCINNRVFVNLPGYVHRLDATMEVEAYNGSSPEEDCWDMITWQKINDSDMTCVKFTFDKYFLVDDDDDDDDDTSESL